MLPCVTLECRSEEYISRNGQKVVIVDYVKAIHGLLGYLLEESMKDSSVSIGIGVSHLLHPLRVIQVQQATT